MKYFFFLCLFIFAWQLGYPQPKPPITAYFDKYWNKVTDTTKASYYRTVEKVNDKFMARDYYMSGQLQMEALCDAVTPKLKWEGTTILYHQNGVKQEEGPFKDEDRYGLHRYWYDNGNHHKEIFFKGGKEIYYQYWSSNGAALLQNGNGIIQDKTGDYLYTYEIKDSLAISSFTIDQISGDSIYGLVEKMAEYKGGFSALGQDLKETMRYPKDARKAGIEGTVFVSFIVDKKGNAKDIKVVKGIASNCDEEAARAVSTLNKWNPALNHGKPVSTRFVLPVKFRLK